MTVIRHDVGKALNSSNYRVMLINPPVLAVFEPWYDTPNFGRVGLAYLASYLRQSPGFDVRILDAKFERLGFQEVLKRAIEWQPDVIGLTAFTNEIKPAAYQAALIKQELPHVRTVIGGVHLTSLPQQTLEEFSGFDLGVVGEGEETFSELCQALRSGQDFSDMPGLVYRAGDSTVLTAPRPRILDQDSIPFPAWELLPPAKEYYVHSLRGCPFNCVFCMNPNGRIARLRSVENVIEELELIIERYHPERISFGDELFSVDMERTHRLLDAMIEHRIGERVGWDIQTHVRFVDYNMLVKMKKAGVTRVELGIETGDEEKLRVLGKGTTIKMIMQAHDAAGRAGVPIGTFFIIGQPNETVTSIKKTIDLAVKLNPILPMFGLMTPYPGTEVARLAAKGEAGYRLISTDWDEYNKQLGGAMEFASLTRRQIEWLQIQAYVKVFLYNRRFVDFAKFVWNYRIGASSVLKKVLLGKASVGELLNRPPDYDAMIRGARSITLEDMIQSRSAWIDVQKREMIHARRQQVHRLPVVQTVE